MAMSGLQAQLLAALSGDPAAKAGYRTVPAERIRGALGWCQPQPCGEAGRDRERYGRALVPGFSAAGGCRAWRRAVPARAGHRRALSFAEGWIRNYVLRLAGTSDF